MPFLLSERQQKSGNATISLIINVRQSHRIKLKNGKILFGLVTAREPDHLMIVTNTASPNPDRVEIEDIEIQVQSEYSVMPKGLLNTLSRAQVLASIRRRECAVWILLQPFGASRCSESVAAGTAALCNSGPIGNATVTKMGALGRCPRVNV